MEGRILAIRGVLFAFVVNTGSAQQAQPRGVYSFGPDEAIADIARRTASWYRDRRVEW